MGDFSHDAGSRCRPIQRLGGFFFGVPGILILAFARDQKKRNGVTVPFNYLGPVGMVSYESDRPIKMVWRLRHPMPVEMFEDNRRGG
jgi:hypothetical protein